MFGSLSIKVKGEDNQPRLLEGSGFELHFFEEVLVFAQNHQFEDFFKVAGELVGSNSVQKILRFGLVLEVMDDVVKLLGQSWVLIL